MKIKKNIAVIGAGLFGCTTALVLSKKHNVDLYERKTDILNEASMCNQFRFHEGFHYPRSVKTFKEIKKSNKDFIDFYGRNIFGKTENYYSITKKDTKTKFKQYIKFLEKNNLKYTIKSKSDFVSKKIEGTILSNEKNLNYFKIKKKIIKKLSESTVNVKLRSQLDQAILRYKKYDHIIIAAYKNNNEIIKKLGFKVTNKFRYELIEKIIIKLPKKYKKTSIVVMDGKFLCLDPYIGTKYHLLSHVKFSKLKVVKGFYSKFPKKYDSRLIKTKSQNIRESRFKDFIRDGSTYLPFLKKAKYISSFFVVRTLKLNVEKTSERTNLTKKINKKIITILAGKWNTCVTESYRILDILS